MKIIQLNAYFVDPGKSTVQCWKCPKALKNYPLSLLFVTHIEALKNNHVFPSLLFIFIDGRACREGGRWRWKGRETLAASLLGTEPHMGLDVRVLLHSGAPLLPL